MKRLWMTLGVTGSIMVAIPLSAQQTSPGGEDSEPMGEVGDLERHKTFKQLDRDNNGLLDQSELDAYGSPAAGAAQDRGEKILRVLDENDDGKVDIRELQEGGEAAGKDQNWW
ncbi:hypothetical protein RE428_45940 [Marinobacter nanhaiticus D15-8W]|nr:hypothetical protein [Marinobacter nanhaiticus]BES73576.1 hypothetical protein RE428_45940 [Marinobacter nanhaiticus D15-8W]